MKPHLFTYRDVSRIIRQVEPATVADVPDVIDAVRSGLVDLARGLALGTPVALPALRVLDLVEKIADVIGSLMARSSGDVAALIGAKLGELLGFGAPVESESEETPEGGEGEHGSGQRKEE